ncbi:MAG: alanine:cation symporter family protein [Firmicutes bacterium]|nr:alanine:cation symporter family protein [Bacillota bacterium]
MEFLMDLFYKILGFFWGDLVTIPLPGGGSLGLSLLVILLIPTGIFCTIITRGLPIRLLPEMCRITVEKRTSSTENSASGLQTLIVSTATRVGMGNLAGVVAAVSVGGAGAVFWMWFSALLGAATSYVESVLAQLYKEKDPLYDGYRGGPAYYIHDFCTRKKRAAGKACRYSIIAVLFAISGLICWCGISQVISNSVAESFENAFHINPLYTTIALVLVSAVIVLRKNATVKVLDIIVPIMAVAYFIITIFIIIKNASLLPGVFSDIFQQAFGIKAIAGGGLGAVIMNGVKRGLFSNEAGSGSAPCAAAAADVDHPAKAGLLQALGVIIDTIIICSCTAFIMLLTPADLTEGLTGMDYLQTAMGYHLGGFGVVFIAVTLLMFCLSTFLGVLYYARSNVAYLFGDNWTSQTIYKVIALIMLFIGGLAAYYFVWDLSDLGIALMTVFNLIVLIPMSKEATACLKDYEKNVMLPRKQAKKAGK